MATWPEDENRWLRELFEFELCHECGGDWFDHVVGPDPLGLPHAYCQQLTMFDY